jgi:hypothetical protein
MREHSSSKRRSGIDNVVYFRTTEGFAMGFDDEIASAEIYRSDGKARYDPLLLGALRDELNPCRGKHFGEELLLLLIRLRRSIVCLCHHGEVFVRSCCATRSRY